MSKSFLSVQDISIIIPVHNGGEGFKRCLASIQEFQPPPREIIVIANGDSDGSSAVATAAGLQVISVPQAIGPARARNLGASKAQGEVLFFIDADVTVQCDTLTAICAIFNSEPELSAVIGSYDDSPAEANFLSQYRNLLHHYVHQTGNEEATTFWGACGAIRRDVFAEISGFDEGFTRPSIEDIELGYRLRQAGHRIRLCKSLQIKHLKRWECQSLVATDFFCRALPWTELILREKGLVNDLNLKTESRISVVLIFLLLLSLPMILWYPWAGGISMLIAVVLGMINFPVYHFFYRCRGFWFAVGVIPWHWFYYFYSGLAFLIGMMRHRILNLAVF